MLNAFLSALFLFTTLMVVTLSTGDRPHAQWMLLGSVTVYYPYLRDSVLGFLRVLGGTVMGRRSYSGQRWRSRATSTCGGDHRGGCVPGGGSSSEMRPD